MHTTHPLIEGVFTKLVLIYGSKVEAQYRGQDIAVVKAHWAHELKRLTVADFEWAMRHLPLDAPPNVLQFRAIAHTRPEPTLPSLAAPEVDPARVRAAMERVKALEATLRDGGRTALAWARKLEAREAAREHLTPFQKACWREALRRDTGGGTR
jgi:hypothetical protein